MSDSERGVSIPSSPALDKIQRIREQQLQRKAGGVSFVQGAQNVSVSGTPQPSGSAQRPQTNVLTRSASMGKIDRASRLAALRAARSKDDTQQSLQHATPSEDRYKDGLEAPHVMNPVLASSHQSTPLHSRSNSPAFSNDIRNVSPILREAAKSGEGAVDFLKRKLHENSRIIQDLRDNLEVERAECLREKKMRMEHEAVAGRLRRELAVEKEERQKRDEELDSIVKQATEQYKRSLDLTLSPTKRGQDALGLSRLQVEAEIRQDVMDRATKEKERYEEELREQFDQMLKSFKDSQDEMLTDLRRKYEEERVRNASLEMDLKTAKSTAELEVVESLRREYDEMRTQFEREVSERFQTKQELLESQLEWREQKERQLERQIEESQRSLRDELESEYKRKLEEQRRELEDVQNNRNFRDGVDRHRRIADVNEMKSAHIQDKQHLESRLREEFARELALMEQERDKLVHKLEDTLTKERFAHEREIMDIKSSLNQEALEKESQLRTENDLKLRRELDFAKQEHDRVKAKLTDEREALREEMRKREKEMTELNAKHNEEMQKKYDDLLQRTETNVYQRLQHEFLTKEHQHQLELEAKFAEETRESEAQRARDHESALEDLRARHAQLTKENDDRWRAQVTELTAQLDNERKTHSQAIADQTFQMETFRIQTEEKWREKLVAEKQLLEKRYEQLLNDAQAGYDRERNRIEDLNRDHVSSLQHQREDLEKEVTARLGDMSAKLRQEVSRERDELYEEIRQQRQDLEMERMSMTSKLQAEHELSVRELESKMFQALQEKDEEMEKMRRELNDERMRLEMEIVQKYRNMLEEKEIHIQQLWKDREANWEKQEQKRHEELRIREVKLEEHKLSIEESTRDRYERLLQEFQHKVKNERASAEKQLELERERRLEAENSRHALELEMRKLKHSSMLWRQDYQAETKKKFESIILELENQVERERERSRKSQIEDQEQAMVQEILKKEEEIQRKKQLEEETRQLREDEEERRIREKQDEEIKAEGSMQIDTLRRKIQELWTALETGDIERIEFYESCLKWLEFNPEILNMYQDEHDRLVDQVPLMETIAKREFVKFRMREFQKHATDPSRLFQAERGRLLKEDRERNELNRELAKLNETLVKALSAYENKHGKRFLYQGEQYLEIMTHDIQDIERELEVENMTKHIEQTPRNPSRRSTPVSKSASSRSATPSQRWK